MNSVRAFHTVTAQEFSQVDQVILGYMRLQSTDHQFAERVVILLRWLDQKDLFNLTDWHDVYAEAIAENCDENLPEHWEPMFGWKQRLPSAAQVKASAAAKAAANTAAKAEATALKAKKVAFKAVYKKCRKCVKHVGGDAVGFRLPG